MPKIYKHNNETANPDRYELLKDFCRINRTNPTVAEEHLWALLSQANLPYKFRRQHIVGDYIADFICLKKKLILEADGKYHYTTEQMGEDEMRNNWFMKMGYSVLRFSNDEILFEEKKVIETIRVALSINENK